MRPRRLGMLIAVTIALMGSILLAQGSLIGWRAEVKPGPKHAQFVRGEAPTPPTQL